MGISSPVGLAPAILSRPVKRLLRSFPKKPGAAPGTLVYTGPERAEPVAVHLIEYDRDVLDEKQAVFLRERREIGCQTITGRTQQSN